MAKSKFITNCSDIINWKEVIESLGTPDEINGPPKDWLTRTDFTGNAYYDPLFRLWSAAKMNTAAALVSNYRFEGDHPVTKKMEQILGLEHSESWISRIDPGCIVPYHYDMHVDLRETSRRFICFIDEHQFGQVFMVGEECFYNEPIGNLYEFAEVKGIHAGANVGLHPKYLYHFLGH